MFWPTSTTAAANGSTNNSWLWIIGGIFFFIIIIVLVASFWTSTPKVPVVPPVVAPPTTVMNTGPETVEYHDHVHQAPTYVSPPPSYMTNNPYTPDVQIEAEISAPVEVSPYAIPPQRAGMRAMRANTGQLNRGTPVAVRRVPRQTGAPLPVQGRYQVPAGNSGRTTFNPDPIITGKRQLPDTATRVAGRHSQIGDVTGTLTRDSGSAYEYTDYGTHYVDVVGR